MNIKKGTIFANPQEDIVNCVRHHLPATQNGDNIYQCDKCREETEKL